jgi:dihydrofolate synthase/folylpolyglutamate synthase
VNLVDADVAVITTVDLDHQAWLGPDREAIGAEKAGIARAGRPLVLGEDDPPSSVLRHAYAIGAVAIRAGCDFFDAPADDGTRWCWREPGAEFELPMPVLAAPVQRRNAATAIAALRALPVEIPVAALAAGVATACVAGRLQRLDCNGRTVWLDVAHNPQAATVLAQWLAVQPQAGRTLAVFGVLADKDVAAIAGVLATQVDAWYLAGLPDAGARSRDADDLAGQMPAACHVAARDPGVAEALARALATATADDRVIVFGSFHTVAAALFAWPSLCVGDHRGGPPPA